MTSPIEEAVALLVKAVDYSKVVAEITRTVEAANKLRDDYPACLASLALLGLKDRGKFEEVLRRIDIERLTNPDVRRSDYQRLLMRKRRARFAKMSAIEKLKNPTITPSQLKTQINTANKLLNAAREAYIETVKDDADFNYSEAVHDFWKSTDDGLDAQLAKLRKR